jgi:lipid II:glycine glycyltransferase (peptidoglycan interpeptide bridge formation enzyme)
VNVGHILQWHALQWAKSNGCSEYDFGGYTPGATSGPAWFKAGFGGTVVHFVAPHRRVIRTGAYRVFSLLSRIR